jgi:hypothetical protein
MRVFLLLALVTFPVFAQNVKVEFDPNRPEIGPFPTDFLTVPAPGTPTGLRVNLPVPNCGAEPSTCAEIAAINELDGFNPQARMTVKFGGPINPNSLRQGLYFLWLDPVLRRPYSIGLRGHMTVVNRVVYDPATNTAWAHPDETLEQSRRYAIIVTDSVTDAAGHPVIADEGFAACLRRDIGGKYCEDMSEAAQLASINLGGARIVGGSVFTTMAATSQLEMLWRGLQSAPLSFERGPVVDAATVSGITFRRQVRTDGALSDEILPLPPGFLPGAGIGRIAFGTFATPAGPMLPAFMQVPFHVFLPATPPPAGGYPVILVGHGIGDSRFGIPTLVAANYASRGYAVVAFNAIGHGYGPGSVLRLTTSAGPVDVPAPGRGVDLNGDGFITANEGCVLLAPGFPVGARECLRGTAGDWMMLVRHLRAGLDLDGDGQADLNARRLWYLGQSLGAYYGSLLLAVEPAIEAGVLNVGGASITEAARQSPVLRPFLQLYLGLRQPALLNAFPDFDEQFTGRFLPVTILTKPGAAQIQDVMERLAWIEAPAAPVNYAPHFWAAPLNNVPAKRVLFQMARGDQWIPNPVSSSLVRAAFSWDTNSVYRHDRARQVQPILPADPHAFLAFQLSPVSAPIAAAAFQQALGFLQSGANIVPDVNPLLRPLFGVDLFESPSFLPEDPGYLP